MSSGCGDVLSLEDLKTAKKHQVFEAEVITGHAGGVPSGVAIDTANNPVTDQDQKTMPAIMRDAELAFEDQLTSQENAFQNFLLASGYQFMGDYTSGIITLSSLNQVLRYNGELWRLNASTTPPFTTTGTNSTTWAADSLHFVSVGDAALRQEMAAVTGPGLIGYSILQAFNRGTVGYKLNFQMTPYDFGAIADGTVHPLSERYASLALAQVDYPFVTSLTQSIDYAAFQRCVNEMVTRGAAGMSMGGRGQYALNATVTVNKTASVNEANKYIDFSGAQIMSYGGSLILNDKTFTGWTLANGVTLSGSTLVFAGTTAAQASASITLTGLTVGKKYAVSVVSETYTSEGTLRVRLDGVAISNSNESGPAARYAAFTATATSHVLELRDDTYSVTPTACVVNEVDVREAFYPILLKQAGTAIAHGSLICNNLRIVNKNSNAFGGLRCEDLNHALFDGAIAIDGFYGPAVHMLNMTVWSENNRFIMPKSANNREFIRFNREYINGANTGQNSFARTQIGPMVISGNRYAFVCGPTCSVYDSEIGTVNGNLTSNFRAIFCLHGDQTDTKAAAVRVENNSAPASAGVFEYGLNDLRRLSLGNVGTYTGLNLTASGSFAAGEVTLENDISSHDFRPSVPRFNTLSFGEKSGPLGTGLTYSQGTYMWSEILLNCTPGVAYQIGISRGLSPFHGVVEIDAGLRLADGSSYQGTKFATKVLKGTVASVDASKVVAYSVSHAISSETLALTWPGSSAPALTLTAAANRSIQIFARWTS